MTIHDDDFLAVKQLAAEYLGYLWSTYASVATPKPGVSANPIRDSGVSLLIVKRQPDRSWKVAVMKATRGENPLAASQENGSAD